jgi:hypothetical protein
MSTVNMSNNDIEERIGLLKKLEAAEDDNTRSMSNEQIEECIALLQKLAKAEEDA